MKKRDDEHKLQTMVVDYFEVAKKPDAYLLANPNAAKRSMQLASRMKREGMKPGVADLQIMLPGGRSCWLEMKTAKGRQSPEQKNFEQICLKLHHAYAIARSFDEAVAIFKLWGVLK